MIVTWWVKRKENGRLTAISGAWEPCLVGSGVQHEKRKLILEHWGVVLSGTLGAVWDGSGAQLF